MVSQAVLCAEGRAAGVLKRLAAFGVVEGKEQP